LNTLLNRKNLNPAVFGEWLYKNYCLMAINHECNSIDDETERLEKLHLYGAEIARTLKDLRQLNELFVH